MEKKRLEELAEKYLLGKATEEEKNELHGWYDENRGSLVEAVRIQSNDSKEDVRLRILNKLKNEIRDENRTRWNKPGIFKVAAAVALVLIGLGIVFWNGSEQIEWIVVEAPYGDLKEMTLPDNSKVWINAGTKFRYPRQFNKKERKVELLTGQAFFDVERDEKRPFLVETSTLEIEVLGTSFDVKSYEGERSARVRVLTGEVDVAQSDNGTGPSVKIVKGEQVVLNYSTGEFKKEEASTEAIAAWKDKRLVFDDESISSVINALERRYNIEIVGDVNDWGSETISIKLDNQPLDDVLDVLKYTIEFDYKKIEKGKIEIMK